MLGALKYRGCWVHVKRRGYGLRAKKVRRRTADFFVFAKAKGVGFWHRCRFRYMDKRKRQKPCDCPAWQSLIFIAICVGNELLTLGYSDYFFGFPWLLYIIIVPIFLLIYFWCQRQ